MSNFVLKPDMHLHIVGIGGSGMSAIARVLLGRGFKVSGSDMRLNEETAVLQQKGALIFNGHNASNIQGADVVVISSAIPQDNPEVQAAQKAGIPVLKRADLLGHLMADNIGIAVAGSHGKTTTTGMIAQILLAGELDPTVVLGGKLDFLDSNGRYGEGDFFIVEADEYDHMFLGLRPEVIVITNIEHDHPDIFPTPEAYRSAFRQFAQLLPEGGHLIACSEDEGVQALLEELDLTGRDVTTYAIGRDNQTADYIALDCRPNQLGGTDFLIESDGQMIGLARLRVPGDHNVRNALAATIVGLDVGLDFETIRKSLAEFGGISRRFQIIGEASGVTIIDDYAHHPTEIRATLAAARQRFPGRRVWAVWQPHTYSRTKQLFTEFSQAFTDADRIIVLDIYPSREKDTLGMDSSQVVAAMPADTAVHIGSREEASEYLLDRIRPDDVVLTLGAGDGNVVGEWVLAGLRKRLEGK
jgi:UDP-N-acetylmuramate--alanine ligase